ncbi:MAG: hypothetical protein JO041_12355, partial [Acidobacteria bacterium]|nr:hypothetical protein [Acidobacteriota bacterium]
PLYAYGFPYFYSPFWNDSFAWSDPQPQTEQAYGSQDSALTSEVINLRNQVAQLEAQQAERSLPAEPAMPPGAQPATALVFRDGRRLEVHNYAIVGEALWVLNESMATRVAMSDIDLPATVKANEERGVTFRVPRPQAP